MDCYSARSEMCVCVCVYSHLEWCKKSRTLNLQHQTISDMAYAGPAWYGRARARVRVCVNGRNRNPNRIIVNQIGNAWNVSLVFMSDTRKIWMPLPWTAGAGPCFNFRILLLPLTHSLRSHPMHFHSMPFSECIYSARWQKTLPHWPAISSQYPRVSIPLRNSMARLPIYAIMKTIRTHSTTCKAPYSAKRIGK